MNKILVYLAITLLVSGCFVRNFTSVVEEPTEAINENRQTEQTTATTHPTEDFGTTAKEDVVPTTTRSLPPWPPIEESAWPPEAMAPWPTNNWETSSPEAQGIDSQELVEMLEFIDEQRDVFNSLLLIRNGYLVLEVYWEPSNENSIHPQYSLTKPIVAALVGITYKDGHFEDEHQPFIDLLPDLNFNPIEPNISSVTVKDVLTMSAGMDWKGVTLEEILSGELTHEPGTYFEYSNPPSLLMTHAVQQMTGLDPYQFADERLFSPIGISNENFEWGMIGEGKFRDGANGLRLRPRDMARIGYLFLNNGEWDGEEILPASWVAQSIYPYSFDNFSNSDVATDGFGYFWWINREQGYYSGIGLGGQMIVVFPGKNMILVTTGDLRASSGFIHYATLSNFIVPLTISDSPLPENPAAAAELQKFVKKFSGIQE